MSIVTSLRPSAMRSRPIRIGPIFERSDEVLRIIEARSPYITMAAYHRMEEALGGERSQPFYRGAFDDDLFLHNPVWLEAARACFDARIVQPIRCILNLNAPMTGTGVHVDLPMFRGFAAPAIPVWLLMNMSYSGLFHDWMIPIASGLAWFWRGEGGAFAYWPRGGEAPPELERSPLWNSGVMSDNEFMFHGVTPIGAPGRRADLQGTLSAFDKLWFAGDGCWEIRKDSRMVHRLSAGEVRISLLWKAYVFRDEAHLASFEDRSMDLTLDSVVDIYLADLARKGVTYARPAAPLADKAWQQLLEATYPQPLTPHAADALG